MEKLTSSQQTRQRQRFRRRAITKYPSVIRCLDQTDWIQICILILFNFPLYHDFSLDNDVSDIKTLSHLALIFVFMAKCLTK